MTRAGKKETARRSEPNGRGRERNLKVMTLGLAWIGALLAEPGGEDAAGAAAAYQEARARHAREPDARPAIDRLSALFRLSPFDEDLLLLALSAQLHGTAEAGNPASGAGDSSALDGDEALGKVVGAAWRPRAVAALSADRLRGAPVSAATTPFVIDERVGRYLMGEDVARSAHRRARRAG